MGSKFPGDPGGRIFTGGDFKIEGSQGLFEQAKSTKLIEILNIKTIEHELK